jgi:hypothetical protein
MSTTNDLASLFDRDLKRLKQQIETFPNDETLWQALPGANNPAGNLALHIEGNLLEFVGRQLGRLPYNRNRELEFSARGVSKHELGERLEELRRTIPAIIENLSTEQMEMEYPQVVLETATSTQEFLIHLYGHLNWHRGQIDYLRRSLNAEGEI